MQRNDMLQGECVCPFGFRTDFGNCIDGWAR
jgi:hypothetical protein